MSPSSGTVVIIDDDEYQLDLATRALTPRGIQVHTSTNPDCSALILEHRPQLVLIDVCMEGLQGDQLAQILKETPGMGDDAYIVLHSNLSSDELEEKVRSSGADGYIAKSPDVTVLQAQVAHWLIRHRTRERDARRGDTT